MGAIARHSFWIKSAQALLLAVAVCFSLGASDAGLRFDNLGDRLMCTCGCAQLLGKCAHIGCPSQGEENVLLRTAIASGQNDQQILNLFATKYGETVLAAPRTHGFDLVAWIAPFAVFAAALLGTILLVRRWSGVQAQPATSSDPAHLNAQRERIRRETGGDGGF